MPATALPPTVAAVPVTPDVQPNAPISTQGPFEPPLQSPQPGALPTRADTLSLDQWLLSPTLGVYSLFDTNVHSSPTLPLSGPGFHFHPALSAEYNTGLYDTQLYGNIDSTVYPTLDYHNNTFNKNAGAIERYSPLPDLTFTMQGDYAHNTNANVLLNSLPTPVVAPGSPQPQGAAAVVATQQTVVNPNDVYTAQATVYKELNRAFIRLNTSVTSTIFEETPTQNLNQKTYDGSGGFWFTPQLYAYGDGIQTFSNPEVGTPSNFFRARGGIGSDQIGLFQGSIYYGQQGSEVNSGGKAGGDIYGGIVSYFPTAVWNMSLSVDRQRNVSDITVETGLGLGGLGLAAAGVSPSSSIQSTALAFKTNYTISEQTSAYFVLSDTLIDFIHGPPLRENSWLADVGISHQLRHDLRLTFDYSYTRFMSPTPLTSFTRNLVTLGANYNF
jgi:hypothetical protein